MSDGYTPSMTELVLRRLGHGDEERARRFLFAHPERDLYLRGLVLRLGTVLPPGCGVLYGALSGDRLVGIFLHSPTLLLASPSPAALEAFAAHVAAHIDEQPVTEVLGPADMVRGFFDAFRALRPEFPAVRLYRDDLPLLELRSTDLTRRLVTAPGGGRVTAGPLRRAVDRDIEVLTAACRAMTVEELGVDPAEEDPVAFHRNVERKVRAGREYVWTENTEILFRAAVSTSTPEAALVEGVFTPPTHRGRGLATRGMLALCRRLLRNHSAVVLFVSAGNGPALRLYDRLGFRRIGTYQAVYFSNPSSVPSRAVAP